MNRKKKKKEKNSTEKELFLIKGVNKQISFIPHKTKTFNDREPPWINNKAKTIIQEKNKTYQLYLNKKSNTLATCKICYKT